MFLLRCLKSGLKTKEIKGLWTCHQETLWFGSPQTGQWKRCCRPWKLQWNWLPRDTKWLGTALFWPQVVHRLFWCDVSKATWEAPSFFWIDLCCSYSESLVGRCWKDQPMDFNVFGEPVLLGLRICQGQRLQNWIGPRRRSSLSGQDLIFFLSIGMAINIQLHWAVC